jgi:N6-L-threonylcarbamoyladenine synthase
MNTEYLVLGIETSCDETAAAVYSASRGLLSNELFSQIELHKKYGGVVPEIASRSHIEKISYIVGRALTTAQVTLDQINLIAVTNKPGLPGSLLVGVCFAKALALAKNIPIVGVNHLEGHAFSAFLQDDVPFPHLCLTASGGHTALYIIRGFGDYEIVGQTLDDAAGEAFDKIAKLLGLGYPGGPIIERLAQEQQFQEFFSYPRGNTTTLNFSFSGLKTAVLYDLVRRSLYNLETKEFSPAMNEIITAQVASSLLVCVRDIFIQKLTLAHKLHPEIEALSFVGGVACNKYLKNELRSCAQQRKLSFFSPASQFCTDNAAMIAFVGHYKAQQGIFSDLNLDILV